MPSSRAIDTFRKGLQSVIGVLHAGTVGGSNGTVATGDQTLTINGGTVNVTGDIATLDEDGFLQITDRLTRFSKIGGEMVPHIKVEEKLQELTGNTEPCFAVTGVPDERKGERLVVLHKLVRRPLISLLRLIP